MDLERYKPDAGAVEQIRRDLAVYESERVKAADQVSWRVPLFVGPYALLAAAVLFVAWQVTPPENKFIVMLVLGCGALFVGHWVHVFARAPATDTQQWLRDRVLPIAFGFMDDVQYRHGVVPSSFSHLPTEVTGAFDRREFDDAILGRHDGAWFEIFECHLTRDTRKSTTTVFKGVILAFKIDPAFDGKLIATRKIGGFDKWIRDFSGTGDMVEVTSGDAALDHDYEFRTDNPQAARELLNGNLRKALSWVRETWPEELARIALSHDNGFLLLPIARKNFFELPDISASLDYDVHIQPIAADMASLIATGALVRQACAPTRKN